MRTRPIDNKRMSTYTTTTRPTHLIPLFIRGGPVLVRATSREATRSSSGRIGCDRRADSDEFYCLYEGRVTAFIHRREQIGGTRKFLIRRI